MASSEAQEEFNNLMRDKERRHRHPEDVDSSDDNHGNAVQDDQIPNEALPRPSMSSARDIVPRTRYGANTGPKGVISDAQNFRDSRRTQRAARLSTSTTTPPVEPELKLGEHLAMEKLAEAEEQGDLEDGLNDMDDEFMAQWRRQRLQDMQRGGYSNTMHGGSSDRRLYGVLTEVNGEGYLEAIEGSDGNTVVVVYICDDDVGIRMLATLLLLMFPQSEVSQLFEDCLTTLAAKHQTTRFIKLDYEEAEIQSAGVPGIIAYRAGEKFAALIPVLDEMPEDGDLDAATLEKVLQRYV